MTDSRKMDRQRSARSPRSLTRKGRQTRTLLLDAARDVFKSLGYCSTSVSEISRRAGLSQGAFYQYFKNKEQIFQELNDLILNRFWQKANVLPSGEQPYPEGLRPVVELLIGHAREHSYFHRILGEFELIDPAAIGYFDSLARYTRFFFRTEAIEGRARALDPNLIAYGLIGLAIFQAMDWGEDEETYEPEQLVDYTIRFTRRGIGGPKPWDRPTDLSISSFQHPSPGRQRQQDELPQGRATARAILQAAEKVFGRHGYHRASVADITREAGVAQGTFYVHFKSKRDLLEGCVRYMSREMRRELKMASDGLPDRRDVEREGILAFFRFLSPHRQIYRVVTESETMGREMAMWYYKKLAAGYRLGLAEGVILGQIRDDLPIPYMVRALMGVTHMIGLKWLVWNAAPQAELPGHLGGDVIGFLLDGLDPSSSE